MDKAQMRILRFYSFVVLVHAHCWENLDNIDEPFGFVRKYSSAAQSVCSRAALSKRRESTHGFYVRDTFPSSSSWLKYPFSRLHTCRQLRAPNAMSCSHVYFNYRKLVAFRQRFSDECERFQPSVPTGATLNFTLIQQPASHSLH